MADTVRNSDRESVRDSARGSESVALALGETLAEHKGGDVVVLDVGQQAGWTDRFVIATATSTAHLRGLARFVDEELAKLGLSRLSRSSLSDDDEWLLIDLGGVVVHVMTERARAFYELEKLWFQSPAIRIAPKEAPAR
jgi:ribosome-associated protein